MKKGVKDEEKKGSKYLRIPTETIEETKFKELRDKDKIVQIIFEIRDLTPFKIKFPSLQR